MSDPWRKLRRLYCGVWKFMALEGGLDLVFDVPRLAADLEAGGHVDASFGGEEDLVAEAGAYKSEGRATTEDRKGELEEPDR